jgi:hypothetical protein
MRRAAARRRRVGLAGALLVILLAIAVALPVPSLGGASVAVAAIQRAKSFVELMHQRSPGKRLVGRLVKTKHKKLAAHERALPKIRKPLPEIAAIPPMGPLPPALVDLVAPPVPMQMASLEAVPVGPFQTPLPGPPGFFSPPPGGFVFPPGSPNSPPIVTPPGPPPPAVPEPATWAMILLGFGMIGWTLRRSQQQEQTAA